MKWGANAQAHQLLARLYEDIKLTTGGLVKTRTMIRPRIPLRPDCSLVRIYSLRSVVKFVFTLTFKQVC